MTFRDFLDASYALLHENYGRLDETIPMATERLKSWAQVAPEKTTATVPSANDEAIAALQARMAGVAGKPKMA